MLIRHDETLAPWTTLGIGGPADLIELTTTREIHDIDHYTSTRRTRPVCLGSGSNVLVADAGTTAPVLHLGNVGITATKSSRDDRVSLTAEAGTPLADLIAYTLAEGLSGMETMAGIPGTVGAIPVQNVGAYGQETADTLTEVTAWDWDHHALVAIRNDQCGFGHRTSRFKHTTRYTILTVTLTFTPSRLSAPIVYRELAAALDVPTGTQLPLQQVADAVVAIRRTKGMVIDPADPDSRSVGSVFPSAILTPDQVTYLLAKGASPHTYPDGTTRVGASWLIREAGYTLGQRLAEGVRISTKHHTLIAEPDATATNFAHAALLIQRAVHQRTGVLLLPEIDLIGNEPTFVDLMDPTPLRTV